MDFSQAIPSSNGSGNGANKPPAGIAGFDDTPPAPEWTPLPPGIYLARVVRGEATTTRAGDDAYKMRFEITEGPQTGKTVVRVWTFSAKALPFSKRELAPFGLTTSAALLSPFPPVGREYHVRLTVALQRGDDLVERNDIKRIEIIRVVESPAAAYLLPPEGERGEGGTPPPAAGTLYGPAGDQLGGIRR